MSRLGDLAPAWRQIDALLDEALSLPAQERGRWLRALPAEHAPLRDTLARLLQVREGIETGDFLGTLPKLSGSPPPGEAMPDAMLPRPGSIVGPWRLVHSLGEGGMGSVWLAERTDGQLKRAVALKLPRLAWDRGLGERMARERDILATLEHPHIARLYDAGIDQLGRPWLALEYVPGRPIDEHARLRSLSPTQRVRLLLQVCEAVAYAQGRLVIHRDLKPSNVMVTEDGQVRLLDFGIARLARPPSATFGAGAPPPTEHAGAALTPGYASPEQLREQPLSTASDVFSLGVVAYELLAGVPPFRFEPRTQAAYERTLAGGAPPLASRACADPAAARLLRGDLDAVLDRALALDPARRYAGADALAADLRAWLAGEAVSARGRTRAEQLQHWARRHKAAVAVGVVAFVALAAAAAVSTVQALHAREQAAQAAAEAEKARKEAARARATQALLKRIFQLNGLDQPDPLRAQRTTARELLDLAARSVGDVMKDTPEAQIELLETLSTLYAELGAPGPSLQAARQRVELARQALPDDDPRRADALLSLSGRLHDTPQRPQARALIEEAEAVMRRAGPAAASLEGALALQKARHERWGRLKEGVEHAERAVAWFREHQPDSGLRVSALYFASALSDISGDPGRGLEHLQEARQIAAARQAGGGRALMAAVADRGDMLVRHGQWAEAEAAYTEAVEVATRLLGADHPSTLVVSMYRARFWIETGRVAAGERERDEMRRRMRERQPPLPGWWIDYANGLMGRLDLDRGRPDLLEPVVRAGVEGMRSSVPDSQVIAMRKRLLAETLIALGRLDEAAVALDAARAVWERASAGLDRTGLDNGFELVGAELQLARGDAAGALARLDEQPRSRAVAAGAFDRGHVRHRLLRAEALRQFGRAEEAAAEARGALADLRRLPEPLSLPAQQAAAELALGRALRDAGRQREAMAAFDRAIALRRAFDLPGSVWLARAEAARRGESARATPGPRAAERPRSP
ncbi:MAG: protein kinase domain-containing protein [Pseudomonadota bacterium]